jgi:hypothetical protein
MSLLWPALPEFLLLARVVAAPRFPQIVGAAVPLFSPTFVGLLGLLPIILPSTPNIAATKPKTENRKNKTSKRR